MWRIPAIETLGLEPGDEGAPYDRKAAVYDRLVRSAAYNRLLWGSSPRDYEQFAARALGDGDGPLLDVAAGSAAATARLYAEATRPVVLLDRSRAMLERAGARIANEAGAGPGPVDLRLVQADALGASMPERSFETILCLGFLHLLDEPQHLVDGLRRLLLPGGRIYASSLVAERPVSRAYLHALHRAGEVAPPRTAPELAALLGGVSLEVRGAMAYVELAA